MLIHWQKFLQEFHLAFKITYQSIYFICKEERWIIVYMCGLSWIQQSYSKGPLSIAIHFRAFGAT